jgi:hypothetical protein
MAGSGKDVPRDVSLQKRRWAAPREVALRRSVPRRTFRRASGGAANVERTPARNEESRVAESRLIRTNRSASRTPGDGPIVMNTEQELEVAFEEIKRGTFIKERP